MKIVNEAMLKLASELAREFGYIETDSRVENLMRSDFWGTRYNAALHYLKMREMLMFEVVRYSMPIFEGEKKDKTAHPRIELRVRFLNPRIDIHLPDGGYVGLEYSMESRHFEEAQIWKDSGFAKASAIKERLETLIKRGGHV